MTREEEAQFWATHSSADYWEDLEEVSAKPNGDTEKHPRRSPRCPVCGEVLLSRYVERETADGRATIHRLRELYCRQGHFARLADDAERVVRAVEKTLAKIDSVPA